jgi:hypothetical protein
VIDEAHMLDHYQLEAVRMLTNHDMDSASPFACLLVGQPTLRRRIKLGVLAALDQRIAVRYHMAGMNAAETAGYIRHHHTLAGRSDTLSAPRGASSYPRHSREKLGRRFLGPMAHLDPKGDGDSSMPGNQRSCSGARGEALGDPCNMAKAGLPLPQSPEGENGHPPEMRPEPAPHLVST